MREYLNGILSFIGAESLTDEELDSLTLANTNDSAEVYSALFDVLQARESLSDMTERLKHYFLAKGLDFSEGSLARSNILIGSAL